MSSEKLNLTKIILTSKEGKQVELSIEDAKDLYEQLKGLFDKEIHLVPTTPIIIERDKWPNTWPPYQPIWIDKQRSYQDPSCPSITCQTQNGMEISYQ